MWNKWCTSHTHTHTYITIDCITIIMNNFEVWWLELNKIYSVMKNTCISKRQDFIILSIPYTIDWNRILNFRSSSLYSLRSCERDSRLNDARARTASVRRETCRGNAGARVQRDARHRIMPERTRRPGARGATGITRSFVTSHLHTSRGVSCASV